LLLSFAYGPAQVSALVLLFFQADLNPGFFPAGADFHVILFISFILFFFLTWLVENKSQVNVAPSSFLCQATRDGEEKAPTREKSHHHHGCRYKGRPAVAASVF